MTNKTTMPEPVASLRTRLTGAVVYPCISTEYLSEGQHDLITTDQAEAYADARVRDYGDVLRGQAKHAGKPLRDRK